MYRKIAAICKLLFLSALFNTANAQEEGIYKLWGTTTFGGPDDLGVLFTTKFDGTVQQIKKKFVVKNPGLPFDHNKPVLYNNKLYAILNAGGLRDHGIICAYDLETKSYSKKADLYKIGGARSTSSLTLYNGKFYGVCESGGTNNKGILFEYNPEDDQLIKRHDFTAATGTQPSGDLVVYNDILYGMTLSGGANGIGVIYQYIPNNFSYSKRRDLVSNVTGGVAKGGFTVVNGFLWGVTGQGTGNALDGSIFAYDPESNSVSFKASMASIGAKLAAGNLAFLNNKLYGVAGLGGLNGKGLIFEYNLQTQALSNEFNFTNTTASGNCEFIVYNDKLYSSTAYGGTNNDDKGVLFSYDPEDNKYEPQITYTTELGYYGTGGVCLTEDNKIYGFTIYGATNGKGCLFEYNLDTKEYVKKVDFGANDVYYPNGKLLYYDNKIYGVASLGGTNQCGGIYEYDIETDTYKIKLNTLPENAGYSDHAAFVILKDNKFYGVTTRGGVNNTGTLFEYDPLTESYTKRHDFLNAEGEKPAGILTDVNGKLYGMCSQGGINNEGTIYEYDIATHTFAHKVSLGGLNGKYPSTGFTLYKEKLYAPIASGGANGFGTIIQYTAGALSCTKLNDFNKVQTGGRAYGGLVEYEDKLYGLAYIGGANDEGTLYRFDPVTFNIDKMVDLSISNGKWPLSTMALLKDKLYGMTTGGGTKDEGVLFEYDLKTGLYTKKIDFIVTNGRVPLASELIKAPAPTAHGSIGNCMNTNSVTINAANKNNNEWVPFTDAEGNAIAEINANGNDLNNVSISYYVHDGSTRINGNGQFYLDRNITITVQNQPVTPVGLRLYIRNTEFESLKNTPGSGITVPSDIGVFKNEDICSDKLIAPATLLSGVSYSIWGFDHVYQTEVSSFSSFYFASKSYTVLPITLESFTGKIEKDINKLEWKASCTNAVDFIIERSSDGINFTSVGVIKATQQDCNQPFSFIDKKPLSRSYYRLKLEEANASPKYSNVVVLNRSNQPSLSIEVIPNPVIGNQATLRVRASRSEKVTITITDILGKIVGTETIQVVAGETQVNMNFNKLGKGNYQLMYEDSGKIKVSRFVKQ